MEFTEKGELHKIILRWEEPKEYCTIDDDYMPAEKPSPKITKKDSSEMQTYTVSPYEICYVIFIKVVEDAIRVALKEEEDVIVRTKSIFSKKIKSAGTLAESEDENNESLKIYLFGGESYITISVNPKASIESVKTSVLDRVKREKPSISIGRTEGIDDFRLSAVSV